MAAIDKTYTSSYEEYQEVVDWAKKNKFTCPNGMIIDPIKYIYKLNKDCFDGDSIPIMNTSHSVDYFLIKYCPIKLVQNRMETVYNKEYIESVKNGTSEFDTFIRPESGTKIKMIKDSVYHNRKPFRFYNYFKNKVVHLVTVDVRYNGELLWYNSDYDTFIFPYELGIVTQSSATLRCKSLKAIIRKLKKWNLPKGCIVTVSGRYVGETWKFKIK